MIINATFRDGVFVPEHPPAITPGAKVTLQVEASEGEASGNGSANQVSSENASAGPVAEFLEYSQQHPIYSGLKLTRDELHDRDRPAMRAGTACCW